MRRMLKVKKLILKKRSKMNKIILWFYLIIIPISFFSCSKIENQIVVKKIYYKISSQKDSVIGFSLREYEFKNDSITEKYVSTNLEGKKLIAFKQVFYKKGSDLFIFSNVQDDNEKYLYFRKTKKDTCFFVDRKLDNFFICTKGVINFEQYKNVYKLYYDEKGSEPKKESLLLNKDYTILARFEDSFNYRKEIITNENEVDAAVKSRFDLLTKKIAWW